MPDNKKRSEADIFKELASVCSLPGFAHAIAAFCFRDNMIGIRDVLKADHLHHTFSRNRLLRTEISTLIGLMAKAPINLKLPSQDLLQDYLNRSEQLLHEMHLAMSGNIFENIDQEIFSDPDFNPFSLAQNLREPIFYGGESAYSFQYRDFAQPKYERDNSWLLSKKGFEIATARKILKTIIIVQSKKLFAEIQGLAGKPQSE